MLRLSDRQLSDEDMALVRAYAFKIHNNLTDDAFTQLPQAFPHSDVPTLDDTRSRFAFLSGFKPELYDCCVRDCCAYTGPLASRTDCPYCHEPRYRSDGKARKHFAYLPIIPRLRKLAENREMATKMRYRAFEHKYTEGQTNDVFCGTHYRTLCQKYVTSQDRVMPFKYFSDPRDIALGFALDGFGPFRRRNNSAWPMLAFNYNLPPDERFHIANTIPLGVIPSKPKDPNSFFRPAITEFLELEVGLPAFDALRNYSKFMQRAYLLYVFGDIPAISMVMYMKGHNSRFPCRMCKIRGVPITNANHHTLYVPLDRSNHPAVAADPDLVPAYNPFSLPMRTEKEIAGIVERLMKMGTVDAFQTLARETGVNGRSIFSYLSTIGWPGSFPYDFMHLIWEDLMKGHLIPLWTGEFKGLDQGRESYEFSKSVWDAIGEATATSGSTIPSAYGPRPANIAKDRKYYNADAWSFWTIYLGPVLLRRRFSKPRYYKHFVELVKLLQICLQFEYSEDDKCKVREGFIEWVRQYERCATFTNFIFSQD